MSLPKVPNVGIQVGRAPCTEPRVSLLLSPNYASLNHLQTSLLSYGVIKDLTSNGRASKPWNVK